MGQRGSDVILRGEAAITFPFTVECKASESLDLVSTIRQAETNAQPGTDWLIVHRRRTLPYPIVIMEWEVFSSLYTAFKCFVREKFHNEKV